jgi:small subunit ribosomal protein S18
MSNETNVGPEHPILDPLSEKALADDGRSEGRARKRTRRKVSYLTLNKIEHVDYKDVNILRRFLTDRGKILPSRQTGNTAKQQRMISRAIKRAREMALLPFVVNELADEPRTPRVYSPKAELSTPEATAE